MSTLPPAPYGIAEKYWASLSDKARSMFDLVRPMPDAVYTVQWPLNILEATLEKTKQEIIESGGTFELDPDFQRGHVWTDAQRSAYVESFLRKTTSGRILFNCPGWANQPAEGGDIAANTFQCIDGLQRLTALCGFMRGEVRVFGGLVASDFKDTPFDPCRPGFSVPIAVFEFTSRADLIGHYLALNAGGSAHTEEELERVRGLLVQTHADHSASAPA